jgi:hypothetical protein
MLVTLVWLELRATAPQQLQAAAEKPLAAVPQQLQMRQHVLTGMLHLLQHIQMRQLRPTGLMR